MNGDHDGFEARSGCGPFGLALLAIFGIVFAVLARKYGWAR